MPYEDDAKRPKTPLPTSTFVAVICFLFFAFVCCSLSFQACSEKFHENNTVLDFESDEDLDLFRWKCRTRFSISSEYTSHGTKSLKMEFFPARQVGFSTAYFQHDWNLARIFNFTVFNPAQERQTLFIRISDDFTRGDLRRSFINNIVIRPGENQITIPVSQLYDSFSRKLNLSSIAGFYIYMKDISSRTVLYFDYFRLI